MNCRKCGIELPDGTVYCTNCGEKTTAENFNAENNGNQYAQYSDNTAYNQGANGFNAPHNGGAYYSGGGYSDNNVQSQYWYPPVNDKAPSLKDYLKWMLLYPLWSLIPGVGFIIYIVVCFKYAFDTTNKAKSNYFKAVLIMQAITIALGAVVMIVMFAVMGVAASAGFSVLEEMDPSYFTDEFSQFLNLFI